MVTRRHTDPVYLQYIWDAVEVPSADRTCDFDSILRFIRNERDPKCDASKLREQLGNALRDKCVSLSGSKYRKNDWTCIPPHSAHDSYCFHCHMPGPVVDCPTCFRVYHESCFKRAFEAKSVINFPDEQYEDDNTSYSVSAPCQTCRRLANTRLNKETTSSDLRAIYSVALERMRSKVPWRTLYTVGYVDELNRNRYFSFKQMNTRIISDKLKSGPTSEGYPNRTHIMADLDLLIHNAAVIYGSKAEMTNTARHIRSLVYKELRESSLCVDCYQRSKGGKPDQGQIVEACRKPHKMIWFQYSSWSFRPCKVLYQNDDGYEVICFGGRRERQSVPPNNAVAMTFSATHLGMRITASLRRALVEARRYVENQRKVTPDFNAEEGLMLCDIPPESPESSYFGNTIPSKNLASSFKTGLKRLRGHTKQKSSSQNRSFPITSTADTNKTAGIVDKSRVPTPSSSASCDTLRPASTVPRAQRLSNNEYSSSLSDTDDNSTCSSSTNSSDGYPLSKRPNYRSVAISSTTKKAVPSPRSSDSTTSATTIGAAAVAPRPSLPASKTTNSTRPFLSRPAVTDTESEPSSSPLGSCSPQRNGKSSLLRRHRSASNSSTATSGTVVESDLSIPESNSSTLNRRNLSVVKRSKKPPKSLKIAQNGLVSEREKSRRQNDVISTSSVMENAIAGIQGNSSGTKKGKKGGCPPVNFSKPPSGSHGVSESSSAKRNPLPPVPTTASSVSSVSPAALSSSSGIGSSLSGDAKSVEASPGDLQCNGNCGAAHSDSTKIKPEDRSRRTMNERLEALTLERDRANERLRELEQYISELQEMHQKEILQTKRFAWCVRCLRRARYYCCPGVSYCSVNCQVKDWNMGHRQMCRNANNDP